MIKLENLQSIRTFSELQIKNISSEILYVYIENDIIKWKISSRGFDISSLKIGLNIENHQDIKQLINQKIVKTIKIPRNIYGVRCTVTTIPIEDNNIIIGSYLIISSHLHPIAAAFNDFAPVIVNLFPEGAFLYMTDLEKVAYKQSSIKFNVQYIQAGHILNSNDYSTQVIKTKKMVSTQIQDDKYGGVVYIAVYPIFSEDNNNEIVATLGIIIPKKTEKQIKDLVNELNDKLINISAAIEELTSSAIDIHSNEDKLDSDILEISKLSQAINDISNFIKDVANQSNMLGLNAAIEAARAGDAGRGFGVVATEIRKLADQSKETVPKIRELTNNIQNKVTLTSELSKSILASSQEQTAATEQITVNIEQISELSNELNEISKRI